MNIQAVTSSFAPAACKPVAPSFTGKADEYYNSMKNICFGTSDISSCGNNAGNDSFSSNSDNLREKYDLACQVAGYYKNQYESLSQKGSCEA